MKRSKVTCNLSVNHSASAGSASYCGISHENHRLIYRFNIFEKKLASAIGPVDIAEWRAVCLAELYRKMIIKTAASSLIRQRKPSDAWGQNGKRKYK